MKKLLVFLGLFATVFVSAQVRFTPGVRAGLNLARLTDTDLDTKADFFIGASAGIQFTKHYKLAPEMTYSRQGAKGQTDSYIYYYDTNGNYFEDYVRRDVDLQLDYLSFAAINSFTFADRFSIMVGPTLEFLVNGNTDTNTDVDLGATLGFEYRTPVGLGVEFRVKKGLADVVDGYDSNYNDSYLFSDYNTNLVLQIGLTYTFNTNKK